MPEVNCVYTDINIYRVNTVEEKLVEHLEAQGLGLALREEMSIKAVLDAITAKQGGFVKGSTGAHALFNAQAEIIAAMVLQLDGGSEGVGGR